MNSPSRSPDYDIAETIVRRTADKVQSEPLDLVPLASAVEPDLLRDFAASEAVLPSSELRFRYSGCEVCVAGDGDVRVTPREE